MKWAVSIVAALFVLGSAVDGLQAAGPTHLVLVAGTQSSIEHVPVVKVRPLYLGVPIQVEGQWLTPLRNAADSLTQEIFMQQVMFMSTANYERVTLAQAYRSGTSSPPVYTTQATLLNRLRRDPGAVTYMSYDVAAGSSGVKIVADLWSGQE